MAENTNTEREALEAYLKDCDKCQIVPDVGGAWHAAFQAGRASLSLPAAGEELLRQIAQASDDGDSDTHLSKHFYNRIMSHIQTPAARPVTPLQCPKCSALWLHWPAEQTGFGKDTLNCRSEKHCDYCEKAGVEHLQRLERVPATLQAPSAALSLPAAGQEPVATDEWKVRGYLAATLKCWHRLTDEEAAELVAMTLRLSGLYPAPQPAPPTEQQAYDMGAKGAPATDAERLLFEAWMRGHCWALCATWDGKSYRSDAEQGGNLDPRAMNTRQLWAAWRDRSALAAPQPAVAAGWVALPGQFPEPGKPVLLDIGKKFPIRAMWAAKHTVEAHDEADPEWSEYDEATDQHYCPQGWYEWNEHEEVHWAVNQTPRAWCDLPQPLPPAPSTEGESNG